MSDTFAEFVSARSSRLLRTAYLLTHDWAMAEDLLQTSMVKAWSAWRRIEADPEPYVRRILVNTYASWWRRRWNGERPTADLPESTLDDQHGAFDARDEVWRALGRLPRRQRAVLVPPRAAALRYPQIRMRIAARNRRRAGLVAAAVAVVFAITGGYASIPRAHVSPGPIASVPGEMFPPYIEGNRLMHSATAPVADRVVTLNWTPSSLDFAVTYRCFDVPGGVMLRGQMAVNGKVLADTGCQGSITLLYKDIASLGDITLRVGEPLTITFTINQAPAPTRGSWRSRSMCPCRSTSTPSPRRRSRSAHCPPGGTARRNSV